MTVDQLLRVLGEVAPLELSEEWDNTGLLIGQRSDDVQSVMTCLTLTPDVAEEAVTKNAQLVVTHHPVLFRAVQKLTDETSEGAMLLSLIRSGIAVYSPHTSYDSAIEGINRQLADSLGLINVQPLRIHDEADETSGAGRYGDLPTTISLEDFVSKVKQALGVEHTWFVGDESASIQRVGIACGSAVEFMKEAEQLGCQALLTGEASFHGCLTARTNGMALVLPGHFATERPAMEHLAQRLAKELPQLTIWASESETDPIRWA